MAPGAPLWQIAVVTASSGLLVIGLKEIGRRHRGAKIAIDFTMAWIAVWGTLYAISIFGVIPSDGWILGVTSAAITSTLMGLYFLLKHLRGRYLRVGKSYAPPMQSALPQPVVTQARWRAFVGRLEYRPRDRPQLPPP